MLSLHKCLATSVLICCQWEPFWWWLNKVLIYKYSKVIIRNQHIYFLFIYIMTNHVWFYLTSMGHLLSSSWSHFDSKIFQAAAGYRDHPWSVRRATKARKAALGHQVSSPATSKGSNIRARFLHGEHKTRKGNSWLCSVTREGRMIRKDSSCMLASCVLNVTSEFQKCVSNGAMQRINGIDSTECTKYWSFSLLPAH